LEFSLVKTFLDYKIRLAYSSFEIGVGCGIAALKIKDKL